MINYSAPNKRSLAKGKLVQIGMILFVVAWVVGFISWFLAIAEMIAVKRFSEWPYLKGTKVLSYAIDYQFEIGSIGRVIQLNHAEAKVIDDSRILFRQKMRIFGLSTPFPIKGIIYLEGESSRVEGRVPLFVQAFLIAWLLGWTVGSLMALSSPESDSGYESLAIGWLFTIGFVVFSLPIERSRAKNTVSEIEESLKGNA